MAKKKDKRKDKTDHLPVRRHVIVINILLLAVLAGLIVWGVASSAFTPGSTAPDTKAVSPTPAVAQSKTLPAAQVVVDELTPDQHKFMKEVFLPRWNVIRAQYPIEDLRQRFDRLTDRIHSGRIKLEVSALYSAKSKTTYCEADRDGRQAIIRFFEPALRDFTERYADQETRDDVLLGMMLHEEYHIDHHVFAPQQPGDQKIAAAMQEADTWWWCCETMYVPMLNAGRLRKPPANEAILTAVRCYRASEGNKLAAPWLDFTLADPNLQRR